MYVVFEREAREFKSYPLKSMSITVSISLHTQDYTVFEHLNHTPQILRVSHTQDYKNIVCITHIYRQTLRSNTGTSFEYAV